MGLARRRNNDLSGSLPNHLGGACAACCRTDQLEFVSRNHKDAFLFGAIPIWERTTLNMNSNSAIRLAYRIRTFADPLPSSWVGGTRSTGYRSRRDQSAGIGTAVQPVTPPAAQSDFRDGSTTAVFSALALALLHLSHPTLVTRVSNSRWCQERPSSSWSHALLSF
jgi:hypothetical protein